MHVAVEALRAAQVPVAVVGDFDVLNDWSVLSRLVESFGADPQVLVADWNIVNSALTSTARTPSVAGMREAVNKAFDSVTEVSVRQLQPVRDALKIESGWDRVKHLGMRGVPNGPPTAACERLIDALARIGVHLIPVGEMEDLLPKVPGHGPAWVSEVLETHAHEAVEADDARNFLCGALSGLFPRS